MRCEIMATLDPAGAELTAQTVLHLDGEAPAGEVTLRINPNLRATSVRGQGIACGFSQFEDGRVVLSWPTGVGGAEPILEVDYADDWHRLTPRENRRARSLVRSSSGCAMTSTGSRCWLTGRRRCCLCRLVATSFSWQHRQGGRRRLRRR